MLGIKNKRKILILLITILIIGIPSSVFADVQKNSNLNEKTKLEQKLENQEQDIKNDMGDIVPESNNISADIAEQIQNAEYGDFNLEKKKEKLSNFVNNLVIKSRTFIIMVYALIVSALCIYIATLGSRNVNKRRNGFYLLIGNTLLFLIFINIPLIVIYFSAIKENYSDISIINGVMNLTKFLRQNSFIISSLLAYLGISKYIVSKQDLPVRKQSIYLLKGYIVVLVVLNIIPVAINFII